MQLIEHLSQNHQKYYGRLTGQVGLPQQRKYWEDLASSYASCGLSNGYHLKETVGNWIKRANDRYDKTCGRTGASSEVLLNNFQISCGNL